MRLIISIVAFLFTFHFLYISCSTNDENDFTENNKDGIIATGKGKITYTGYEPLKNKPVTLYYSIPKGDMADMPVVFVLPGTNRDADNYIQPWIELSKTYNCMVFALEFPKKYYNENEYLTGNVITSSGSFVEKEKWSFSIIEPIFNFIKTQTGNKSTEYYLFGHSAGAQFVHRFVLFNPEAKIKKAISANAGWYTMPSFSTNFPYGLKNTQLTPSDVEAAFKKNLIIHLGQNDNNPNDPSLRKTPEANAQGLHRYDRGIYFYTTSKRTAQSENYIFNWTKRELPNVGHQQERMAKDAAKIMFTP